MPKDVPKSEEEIHNEQVFYQQLRNIRPDIFIIMDILDRTQVNPLVLVKFMRQIRNIATGSRWGTVEAVMEDGIIRVIRGTDTDKVNQQALTGED